MRIAIYARMSTDKQSADAVGDQVALHRAGRRHVRRARAAASAIVLLLGASACGPSKTEEQLIVDCLAVRHAACDSFFGDKVASESDGFARRAQCRDAASASCMEAAR